MNQEVGQQTPVPVDRTIAAARQRIGKWRADGQSIALVPTMGALHAGHLALVRHARQLADRVVISVFVNPAQFAPTEDFASYPRDLDADLAKLSHLVDLVFVPTVDEIYPPDFATRVVVEGPAEGLESNTRPHFFGGVATVVTRLLVALAPDSAVFGEKDYQQLLVVRRLVADLGLPVDIVSHPIIREADGLALSSRNAYLSEQERRLAPRLHEAIEAAAAAIRNGRPVRLAAADAREALRLGGFVVDYVEVRDADTLATIDPGETPPMRILAAAKLGTTRLIDNVAV